jgi:hypothetical protein
MGAGGGTTGGSGTISIGGGATATGSATGSGAGFGLTMVAAGLISAGVSSASAAWPFVARVDRLTAPSAETPSGDAFGRATRLGLGSSGSSRPLPSFRRSAFASAVSRGVMARTPLCPISSAATMRSLLVTPSSFASSITFTFAAATVPLPPRPGRARPHKTSETRAPDAPAAALARGMRGRDTRTPLAPERSPRHPWPPRLMLAAPAGPTPPSV